MTGSCTSTSYVAAAALSLPSPWRTTPASEVPQGRLAARADLSREPQVVSKPAPHPPSEPAVGATATEPGQRRAHRRMSRSSATHLMHPRVPQFVVTSFWRFVCSVIRMSNSGGLNYRARRRDREQRRRQQAQRELSKEARSPAPEAVVDGGTRRAAATTCGWCGGPITPRGRGPVPKWCSATCRHRAWEQARAAASG